MDSKKLHIDLKANSLHIPEVRKLVEENLKKDLVSAVPSIINRQGELPPFMTTEFGAFSSLMVEARRCYEFGLFFAAVSLICVTAEKFSIELSGKKKGNQDKRLINLKNGGIIRPEHYEKLKKISRIRDKYLHPIKIEEANVKKDALESINLFNDVIMQRFRDKYEIKNGVIYEKGTNIAMKVLVP